MRIVLFTNRESALAEALLRDPDTDVVGIAVPSAKCGKFETVYPETRVLPYSVSENAIADFVKSLKAIRPETLLTYSFQYVLPEAVLDVATGVNLHPALLPKFPGLNPWQEQQRAKVKRGGYTVHCLTETADRGEILGQADFEWDESSGLKALCDRTLKTCGIPLLMKILKNREPQSSSR